MICQYKGKVKFFDQKKGFGFIIGPDGKDVFVHYTNVKTVTNGKRNLSNVDIVSFDIEICQRGKQAVNVFIL